MRNTVPVAYTAVPISVTEGVGHVRRNQRSRSRNHRSRWTGIPSWAEFAPALLPLPHPSPRNNIWLKRHPWFGLSVLPVLKDLVARALA